MMVSIENIHDLELFQLVAELGSFTEAASAAHVSQPPVSQAVKRLEDRLGTVLVERRRFGAGGGVTITPSGIVVVRHTAAILDSINQISIDIGNTSAPGTYRLGLPPIASAYFLGADSMNLLVDRLGGDLSISALGSEKLLEEIRHHNLDFGLVASLGRLPHVDSVVTVEIASFPFGLVTSVDHPPNGIHNHESIDLDRISTLPGMRFVTLNRDFVHFRVANRFLREKVSPTQIIEVADVSMMKTLIASGLAIGLMASISVADDRSLQFNPIVGSTLPTFDVYLFADSSTGMERKGARDFFTLVESKFSGVCGECAGCLPVAAAGA